MWWAVSLICAMIHAILCLESVNIYVLTMKHDAWWAVFLLNCGTHLQWSESLSVNIPKQLNPWHTKKRLLQGEPHSYPYKMGPNRITRVHMGWQIIITFPSKYEFPGQILSKSYHVHSLLLQTSWYLFLTNSWFVNLFVISSCSIIWTRPRKWKRPSRAKGSLWRISL